MFEIKRDVAYTQAYGCRFCLHVGGTAIFIGRKKNGRGPRLELFTDLHRFRWSRGFAFLAVLLAGTLAHAQALPAHVEKQVDRDAVLRCGDMVQHIDGTFRDGIGDVFIEAISPPESDANKWFVYLVTMKGCQPCAQLKAAFMTDERLRAFAKPDDMKASWAHWTVYDKDDKSQAWRFAKIKLTGFPTLLVQPPRSGKWGPPETVVVQKTGYDGNSKKLANDIADGIRRYVEKFRDSQRRSLSPPVKTIALEFSPKVGHEQPPLIGLDPPWIPPDKEGPFSPAPAPNDYPVNIPPDDEGGGLLDSLGFGAVQKMIGFAVSLLLLMLSLACPVAFLAVCVFAGVKAYKMATPKVAASVAPARSGPGPMEPPSYEMPVRVSPAPPSTNQEKLLEELLARLDARTSVRDAVEAAPRTPIDKLTRDVEGALNEVAAENARVAKLKQVVTGTPETPAT